MASHLHDRTATLRPEPQIPWIVRQGLLVPEGALLLVVLGIHWFSGGSALITIIGVLLVVFFATRFAVLTAARQALDHVRYRRARRLLGVALWMYPWSADALALRSSLLTAVGQPAQAEEALRKAIKLFPDQPLFHASLISILLDLDRTIEARWEGSYTLIIDSTCASAYLYLAQVDQRLGAPATDVEQRLRQGLALQSDPATEGALRCALAVVLLTLGQAGESRLMVAGVESLVLRCSPVERAALLYYLGDVRRAQGDSDAAHRHFRASEELDPQGRHAAAAWRGARQ